MLSGFSQAVRRWSLPVVVAGCAAGSGSPFMLSDFSTFTPPEAIAPKLEKAKNTPPPELLQKHRLSFGSLGYSPRSAGGLECIQGTNEPNKRRNAAFLDAEELALLEREGFVTSRARPYPSFALGYLGLYKDDLPVFISADAILHAWHRAYDDLLVAVERTVFTGVLESFLARVRKRISASHAPREVRAALDTHLSVAHSLLLDRLVSAEAGASRTEVERLVELAEASTGTSNVKLFGSDRLVDFSQFKPRGHYEKHRDLIPYFRAMVWLGQIDFRMTQSTVSGGSVFVRREFDAILALREAMDPRALELWRMIDRLVGFFVGMHDSMTVEQIDTLVSALGAKSPAELYAKPDREIERGLRQSTFGKQRIMGHVYYKNPGAPELETNRSFAVFGQRYSLDGHTLHAVTEDRVPDRPLPKGIDVAFSTFGNDYALTLAAPDEHENPTYMGALAAMRALSDNQSEAFWKSSLYSSWLWALRALSPDLEHAPAARVTRTESWARRLLATQLASWSELRHDTILYAKQSYSAGILCDYPDALVEPYPEFFRRLVEQARLGAKVTALARPFATSEPQKRVLESADAYFTRGGEILSELQAMAERNASGKRITKSQLAFVNRMIKRNVSDGGGCGGGVVTYDGWYRELLNGADVEDPDVTVADVHTSPDAGILHVGKQRPRRIVVTVDWPDGVRAYAGAVFSFHEVIESTRLSDSEWENKDPPDPSWLAPILAHARE